MLCASSVFFVFDDPEGLNLYDVYTVIYLHTITANKRERNCTLASWRKTASMIFSNFHIVVYGCIVHPTVIFSIMEWMAAGLEHVRPTVGGY
jgi:hypothetical protein